MDSIAHFWMVLVGKGPTHELQVFLLMGFLPTLLGKVERHLRGILVIEGSHLPTTSICLVVVLLLFELLLSQIINSQHVL